jgi:hypothetical protein
MKKVQVRIQVTTKRQETGKRMTSKDESFDLIHEKQELDIFLLNITGILLSDEVVREKPAAIIKVQEALTGKDHDEAIDLLREKEDIDAFLSGVTAPLLPDKAIKESQPVAARDAIMIRAPYDGVSAHGEPERKDSADEEKIIIDRQEAPAEATGREEQHIILKEEKLTGKSLGPTGIKAEKQPQPADRGIKAKRAVAKESKKNLQGSRLRVVGLFVVFIIITQGYLWLYPDAGYQTIEWMRSNIPLLDRLLGEQKDARNIIIDQIECINVRQRFIQNESLGNLRIIEGTAVNQADFPIAKVKVMGELFDSHGRLVAARISSCGNMLSNEALGRLKEEDIRLLSSIPRDDKILPKGQIPFMIVFKQEPVEVAKATVTAVDAERISP